MPNPYAPYAPNMSDPRYKGLSPEEAYRQYEKDKQHYDMMAELLVKQEEANRLKEKEIEQQRKWQEEQKAEKEYQEKRRKEQEEHNKWERELEETKQTRKDTDRAFIYVEKDENKKNQMIQDFITNYHEYPDLVVMSQGWADELIANFNRKQEEIKEANEKWLAEQRAFEERKARRQYEMDKCKKPLQYDEEGKIIIDFS